MIFWQCEWKLLLEPRSAAKPGYLMRLEAHWKCYFASSRSAWTCGESENRSRADTGTGIHLGDHESCDFYSKVNSLGYSKKEKNTWIQGIIGFQVQFPLSHSSWLAAVSHHCGPHGLAWIWGQNKAFSKMAVQLLISPNLYLKPVLFLHSKYQIHGLWGFPRYTMALNSKYCYHNS